MKKLIFLLWVTGMATLCPAELQIGMRVIPPSQRGYSVQAVRESGERGGLLHAVGTNFTRAYNQEMGDAMELWNAHRWAEAVGAFRRIWQQHPDSPWAAEAELHEACYLKYNSRYDEAEDRFISVLQKYPDAGEMRRKVLRYLPHLYAQTGRYQTGLDLLAEMAKQAVTWQERQFVENYRRIFSRALSKDDADRLCGTKALALALAAQNEKGESLRNVSMDWVFQRQPWAKQKAAHPAGFSVADLAELVGGQPVELDLATLRAAARPGRPVLVHLKPPAEPKCFTVFSRPQRAAALSPRSPNSVSPATGTDRSALAEPPLSGHFVVVESVTDSHVELLDPDSGRTRWPLQHFLYRWSGTALRMAGQPAAMGKPLPPEVAAALRGGCCGNPPPDPSDECDSGDGGSPGWGEEGGPLATTQSRGAGVGVPACRGPGCGGGGGGGAGGGSAMCCEEAEAQEQPQYAMTNDGHGAPVYRFGLSSANLSLKDIPMWTTDAKGPRMNLQLIYNRTATQRMAQHSNANYYAFGNKWHCNFFSHFTVGPHGGPDIVLPGGRVQRFETTCNGDVCVTQPTDIWNRNSLAITNGYFILSFKDSGNKWYFNTNTAVGQRLEKIEDKYNNALTFHYDEPTGRLTNVTDAIGRWFRFYYNAQGYVTNITDSFGRCALFEYQDGDLVAITDMGGETTLIQYDINHWPTNIVYPSGQAWQVAYQQEGILPPYTKGPFAISVTDPLNKTHAYLYTGAGWYGAMPITLRDKAGNNWLYGAKQVGGDPSAGGTLRTYYTAVNAVTNYVENGEYCVSADQWTRSDFDVSTGLRLSTATANTHFQTSIGWVCGAGKWIADLYTTNCYDAARNLRSSTLLTNCIFDWTGELVSGDLVGTWTNHYDSRDNLIWTKNPLDQETHYGYDDKDHLTAVTNALGQFTLMSYDPNGNLTNLVDALRRTNRWLYNADGRQFRSIYADGSSNSLGYDAIGRVSAVTNHGSGLYLSYFYDNLNRMRDVVFPDGTSNHFEYSCCGLDWTRDRLNRLTVYGRDALGRTTSVTDPQNRLTEFRYNGANQITHLITWVGGRQRVKRFDYTSTNGFSRLTQVTTPMGKLIRYDYTFPGRAGLAFTP